MPGREVCAARLEGSFGERRAFVNLAALTEETSQGRL